MSQTGKQVFIVDDDKSVCRALKILLMTYDFKVKTFLSAKDFFTSVPGSVPGCLILDIHMPEMDGWQALKKIVKSNSGRPVIIMSAARDSGQDKQALRNHAAGFLEKPVKVVGVGEEDIKIDFNHPLAGQDLFFSIKVMEVDEK